METSFYTGKIEDESAIYFDADHFNINDGIVDVSDELQKAVNMVVEEYGYGIVFVPEGKYLLSKTIYIPKAVRIIGYGEKRPEFIYGFVRPGNKRRYAACGRIYRYPVSLARCRIRHASLSVDGRYQP